MSDSQFNAKDVAIIARIFGTLFYTAPEKFENTQLQLFFENDVETGVESIDTVLTAFKLADKTALQAEYERLFTPVSPFVAPPWSSVYLDASNPQFGPSTQAYLDFVVHCGMGRQEGTTDPEDHVGLMLMVLSLLMDDEQEQHVKEMLGEYLLTWYPWFCEEVCQHAEQSAYVTLARETQSLLNSVQAEYKPQVLIKNRFFTSEK